jgi:hypothetical protein
MGESPPLISAPRRVPDSSYEETWSFASGKRRSGWSGSTELAEVLALLGNAQNIFSCSWHFFSGRPSHLRLKIKSRYNKRLEAAHAASTAVPSPVAASPFTRQSQIVERSGIAWINCFSAWMFDFYSQAFALPSALVQSACNFCRWSAAILGSKVRSMPQCDASSSREL